jgi:predicted MPP superfamily phosphohydrolase
MTLYAFAIIVLPYILVGFRLNKALGIIFPQHHILIKRVIISAFTIINLLPLAVIIMYFSGNLSQFTLSREVSLFDYLLVFPFWIGFLTIFELFFYFLAIDLIQFATGLITKFKNKFVKPFALTRIILFIALFVFVSIRSYSDTYSIRVDAYALHLSDIPQELKGFNLAFVGDIQIDRYTQAKKINAFHEQLKTINPDLLLFAGDLVTRGTYFIPQGLDVMCRTSAQVERIACVGDHDIWSDARQIARGLTECGWTFLDDAHRIVEYRGKRILVTGVTYVYSRRIEANRLAQLLDDAPSADLKILLVHQPSRMVIETARRHGYHIMLAGHTHGGQIVFKPFGITLTPTMFENAYYSGKFNLGSLNLFVTNGIGLTMMPLRFRAPAEVQQIVIN